MKSKLNRKDQFPRHTGGEKGTNLPVYPLYPTGENIYNRFDIESEMNAKEFFDIRGFEDTGGTSREKVLESGDLDIFGAEQDDAEDTGNEDEKNNYFSLGEDRHNALEGD